jgi:hypothetical protein
LREETVPKRTIFRPTAVEAYRRGGEKDVIPRLISRPVAVGRWLLLAVLVTAATLSWAVRVPAYVGATGVLAGSGDASATSAQSTALLVLRLQDAPGVAVGRPVRLQVGGPTTVTQGEVTEVEPGVITPPEAPRRFPALGPGLVTQPSVVVVVRLADPPTSGAAAGSRVTARVQVGAQRLVALLPGLPSRSAG